MNRDGQEINIKLNGKPLSAFLVGLFFFHHQKQKRRTFGLANRINISLVIYNYISFYVLIILGGRNG
jgi:hypothetical protein